MTTSQRNRPVMFRAGAAPAEQPPPPGPLAAAHPAVILPGVTLLADISEFQPDVSDAVYLAWSKAIIIRAAYGAAHDDRAWRGGQRRDMLHSGGVRFLGIYQYVVAGQDVAAQAREFCRLIGRPRAGEYYIADIEEGAGSLRHTWNTWTAVVTGTLGAVPCGNYSGRIFARDHGLAPVDWIASYGTAEPPEQHLLWQFTDSFQVPGIGRCDCSVFHGSAGQLAALAYQPARPAPQPQPVTEEDTVIVLDLPASGPAVVLPVPPGAKTLTLYADDGFNSPQPPQVRVVFAGTAHGVQDAMPRWTAPAVLPVPAGSHSVSLARLGAGTTPVTAAWT